MYSLNSPSQFIFNLLYSTSLSYNFLLLFVFTVAYHQSNIKTVSEEKTKLISSWLHKQKVRVLVMLELIYNNIFGTI